MLRVFILSIFISVFTSGTSSFGQSNSPEKIKIAFIGTIHFTPSTTDLYSNNELSVSGEKRQREIKEVVDKITVFNPSQICVEYPLTSQSSLDSLYNEYVNARYSLKDDEIDQLGFRSAKALGLKKLTAVNRYGKFDSDTVMTYAQAHDQMHILSELGQFGERFLNEVNETLAQETIGDFLIYINSKEALDKNASVYTKYFMSVGKEEAYVGTKLVADWYSTNLHIYTNILRQVNPSDSAILVVFGQGHVPILKHLFESNPDFEVVEVSEILQ